MAGLDSSYFIFLDKQGKRWPRLRILILVLIVSVFIGLVVFIQALFVIPEFQFPAAIRQMKARLKTFQKQEIRSLVQPSKPLWLEYSKNSGSDTAKIPLPPRSAQPGREIRLGFHSGWDPRSYESLNAIGNLLTHVCPEWMTMVDGEGNIDVKPDRKAALYAEKKAIVLMPLLSNLFENMRLPETVEGLINGPESRVMFFISTLIAELNKVHAGGVVIDWGEVDPIYKDGFTALLLRIATALHTEHMELWLCVPIGIELKLFDLEQLSSGIDRFIAMLHDQNSEKDAPGPIAAQDWFEGWFQVLTSYGDSSQWVISIGAYGYDWTAGENIAEIVDFPDIMTRAGRAGLQANDIETVSLNPTFEYQDDEESHTVWFLDAGSALNEMRYAIENGVGGFAINRLGTEDPGIWKAFSMTDILQPTEKELSSLTSIKSEGITAHVGKGEFLTVDSTFSDGQRELLVDSTGKIAEIYKKFPVYKTIYHQGDGDPDQVSISFDDGPDPQWTPQILDILKASGVKASFFMVGARMEARPDLVKRILAEGHEIGIHTYTHPNLAKVSDERALLELNATQRLIETITGRSTLLFRPPYNSDSRPYTDEEIVAVETAQRLGYLTVTDTIDPEDWARPGSDIILQRVKDSRNNGNIILLHDAGGNRGETVTALPGIIDYLQARGDRIVSLAELIGETHDFLMPPIKTDQHPLVRVISENGFRVMHVVETALWAFMMTATALTFFRALFVAIIAFVHRRREKQGENSLFSPPVSVLIAAYNEEKVIRETLLSVLNSDYPSLLEIVVVDDGSIDATGRIVEEEARKDSRIRLIQKANQGKATALQTGLAEVKNDIIVTLDADTRFSERTIGDLVRPFQSDRIAAVSGHVRVGNPRTFIAKCQSLEYICGFNLDRRAYAFLNCITVVPGAASAFRKSAVDEAGGISTDTLAEDTDLTLSLHERGYSIAYAAAATGWTEAPESIRDLAKQRFRWAFGTLQCLWKHRDMVFSSRHRFLGWFSLPGTWFFQIILVAIAPVVDLLLIISIIFGVGAEIWFYFLIFLLIDACLAIAACAVEEEPLWQAWRIIPMRVLYRPLLSWVVWKSILKAIKGAWVSWDKLKRTASVESGMWSIEKNGKMRV
jgi:peptidoglycan-N-acetylglucosamine deacetylase